MLEFAKVNDIKHYHNITMKLFFFSQQQQQQK